MDSTWVVCFNFNFIYSQYNSLQIKARPESVGVFDWGMGGEEGGWRGVWPRYLGIMNMEIQT